MVPQSLYLILCFLTVGLSQSVGGRYTCTAKDFIRLGNSCYYLSSEIVSWQEAHFRCRDRDAQLAVLGTQYEDTTLRNYLERPEFAQLGRWIGGFWVGGSDRKWIWAAQGNDVEYKRGFATTSVLDLQGDQGWMCLYMDPQHRYRWSNENCIRQLHYICELAPLAKETVEEDATSTTTTTTTTTQEPFGMVEDLYEDDEDDDDDDEDEIRSESESSSDS